MTVRRCGIGRQAGAHDVGDHGIQRGEAQYELTILGLSGRHGSWGWLWGPLEGHEPTNGPISGKQCTRNPSRRTSRENGESAVQVGVLEAHLTVDGTRKCRPELGLKQGAPAADCLTRDRACTSRRVAAIETST